MQIGVGRGADARGIAQANILPVHGQVEIEFAVVGGRVAAKCHQTAAGVRGETLDLQPVLIEDQRAVDVAQRAGQINIGDGAVVNLHPALGKGFGQPCLPPTNPPRPRRKK